MIPLITAVLLTTTPPTYCDEIYEVLRDAVVEGVFTDKEADELYERCVNKSIAS